MLAMYGQDYVPEKYPDYRNRVFDKHHNKLKNQLLQIKQCSLKPEDKEKLKKRLAELLNS